MSLKHELQSVISGNGTVRNGKIIQTITDHLRRKKTTVSEAAKAKLDKEQETQVLIELAESEGGACGASGSSSSKDKSKSNATQALK